MVSRNPLTSRHCGRQRSVAVAPWRHNRLILLLIIFLIGCSPVSPSGTAVPVESIVPSENITLTPAPPTATPPHSGISSGQIRNAQYQLGFTDAPQTVQLTNGEFREGLAGSTGYMEIRVTDVMAFGDIDGDGVNEAAAMVSENYGGTGVFVFLALYTERAGGPVFLTSVFLDDRPVVSDLRFETDGIFVSAITHGAEDPFCCPTLRNERHYRLINNQLELTDYTTFTPDGRPRSIVIEAPVQGAEVFSSVQIRGRVAIAPFENNLAYRIYDVGGVELSAGAVSVSAPDPGAPGTFETMINIGGLLSGSLIRLELQDVSAADGSLFAMDSVELVVK